MFVAVVSLHKPIPHQPHSIVFIGFNWKIFLPLCGEEPRGKFCWIPLEWYHRWPFWLPGIHNHYCASRKRSYCPPASSARWSMLIPSTILLCVSQMNCVCQSSAVRTILAHTGSNNLSYGGALRCCSQPGHPPTPLKVLKDFQELPIRQRRTSGCSTHPSERKPWKDPIILHTYKAVRVQGVPVTAG